MAAFLLTGALTGATVGPMASARAVQAAQSGVVSAIPAAYTPQVANGTVYAIAQVGNKVVVGGSFTSVSQTKGSATMTRNHILAFDAATGVIDPNFAPSLDGEVDALLPGPDGNSVYVGGKFKTVDGAPSNRLAFLDTGTGGRVAGFTVPAIAGSEVADLALSGGRLFLGGQFSKVSGTAHGGLATVNPTTGAIDPYLDVQLAGHHNYGRNCDPAANRCASSAVGTYKFDISPDGSRLVAVGNFTTADGLPRDQAAMLDLGPTAAVDPNWQTNGYTAACFSWAFDSYIRDVDFSPDGSYFVIVATGGPNGDRTLCDSAARFDTATTGSDVRPAWVDWTGGDSLWSVAVTGAAVYVGGHQRWLNNAYGGDSAGPGAVPRPGLGALDPGNGVPLSWNPGRNPRGAGAFALLATPAGLYVGSDTTYIGNRKYYRGRLAFFPTKGGAPVASTGTPTLPGTVYAAGRLGGAASNVLYRVNAGGPALPATDDGPDWAGDGDTSPYRNTGCCSAYFGPGERVDGTVPATTPTAIFDDEHWDPGSQNDGGEMHWAFPVPAGTPIEVRLYFANRCGCTNYPGGRVFDVAINGTTVLDHYDIVANVGDQVGTMKAYDIPSDGEVDIDFTHEVENPLVNGIEIVKTGTAPNPAGNDVLTGRQFDGTTATDATTLPDAGIAWSQVRGAALIDGQLWYGMSDGTLHERSFDGSTFGPDRVVDPYDDPYWSPISTGSGQTYRGKTPGLYADLSNVTGMFYADGSLYYTRFGDPHMYAQGFTPDSGIVDPERATVADGMDWSDVSGMFRSGSDLYYASRSDGSLHHVTFSNGVAQGPSTVVDNSQDWRARALFLGPPS